MANKKAVSDEEIIAAILQHGTIKEAAQAAGLSTRAIYDRMDSREFRSMYMFVKSDIIRNAVFSINQKLSDAINTVAEIMADKNTNPATRLQAAQTIINNAGKFAERLTKDEQSSMAEGKAPFDIEW